MRSTKLYFVHVNVLNADGSTLTDYKLDWNDRAQRSLFAHQADAAVRNNQSVLTMPERLWCELHNQEGT